MMIMDKRYFFSTFNMIYFLKSLHIISKAKKFDLIFITLHFFCFFDCFPALSSVKSAIKSDNIIYQVRINSSMRFYCQLPPRKCTADFPFSNKQNMNLLFLMPFFENTATKINKYSDVNFQILGRNRKSDFFMSFFAKIINIMMLILKTSPLSVSRKSVHVKSRKFPLCKSRHKILATNLSIKKKYQFFVIRCTLKFAWIWSFGRLILSFLLFKLFASSDLLFTNNSYHGIFCKAAT